MKSAKTVIKDICFLALIVSMLTLTSAPIFAEEVETSGETAVVSDTPSETAVADESESNATDQDKANDKKAEELTPEATTMSTSEEGGQVDALVSSVAVPEPSLFSGSATTSIPIIVPPGRGGVAPDLALIYNSSSKNSWVGVGWDLDMGAIQRSTKRGVDYGADDYVVALSGSSTELVDRSNDWGLNHYGEKIEGEFTKYVKSAGGWVATTKDGTKYFYGTTSSSRQYDPQDSNRVFKWCLDRVEDTNGNYMTLDYDKDAGEIYLERIDYTMNVSGVSSNNYVLFNKESRTDHYPIWTPDFQVDTAYRLKYIKVYANNGEFVRKYKLNYTINGTHRSVLNQVTLYGSDNDETLPDMTFTYSDFSVGFQESTWSIYGEDWDWVADFNGDGRSDIARTQYPYNNVEMHLSTGVGFDNQNWLLPAGFVRNDSAAGDFNGDGKTDLAEYDNGIMNVYLSTGTGFTYQAWTTWITFRTPFWVADFNGDGKDDIACLDSDKFYVHLSTGTGFDGQTWNVPEDTLPVILHAPEELRLGDFNGDGKMDFVYLESNDQVYIHLSTGTGLDTQQWSLQIDHSNTDLIQLGDFNDDGKTDIASIYEPKVPPLTPKANMNFSTGSGFDAQIWDFDQPLFGYDFMLTGDFNGDGKTDIASGDNQHIYLQFSKGDAFDAQSVYFSSGFPASDSIKAADFTGDGITDIAMSHPWNGAYMYIPQTPVPDLLNSIENGRGATSEIEYTPSSEYDNTVLPYVIQTVSQITVSDGLGGQYQSAFDYGEGFYDTGEKEFRGFGWASKTNPDGTYAKTEFLQGEYNQGLQEKSEFYASAGGTLLSEATFTWDDTVIIGDSRFVKLTSKHSVLYDGATVVETDETYSYDNTNGNLLSTTASGPDAENLTTVKEYENFGGTGGWNWRLIEESLSGSVSGTVRKTTYAYESLTGNLLSQTACLNIGAETGPTASFEYDGYGNLIKAYDPMGNFTETVYDTSTKTYPTMVKYPKTANGTIEHNVQKEYDYKFGAVSAEIDENGNRTDYTFDEFGRVVQVDAPDGGQFLTEYHDDVIPNYVVTKVKENASSTIESYAYADGLGRERQTVSLGENNQIIRTLNTYDSMGRISEVAGPYFYGTSFAYSDTLPSQCPKTQTLYDERGRPEIIKSNDTTWGWNQTEFSYDGLSTTITDPDGKQKTERTDYLGRIIQVIEYNGVEQYNTYYQYNAAGDLLEVKDHYNTITTIEYDALGRKTGMTDPDMGTWLYPSYDANGNLLTQKSSLDIYTYFEYDELNRITNKSYSTAYTPTVYIYDNLSIPNGRGQLASMSNSQSTSVYNEYDEMGRIISLTKTITGDSARTTTYGYDLSGKKTHMGYPDGFQVYYEYYPGTGLLEAVSGSDFLEYARYSNYEATGKIGQIDHTANGTQTEYQYDPESNRLTKITTHDPSGLPGNDIQRKRYEYTGAGNIASIIDEKDGNKTYAYEYDGIHRLTYERINGVINAMYTYNAVGNIMSRTIGADTYTYTYDAVKKHAVTNINKNGADYAFTYDSTGNMRTGYDFSDPAQMATRDIYYNVENMPERIVHYKGGVTNDTRFYYDGENQRVKKELVGSSTTYYIGDHIEKINGSLVKYIFAAGMRIAKIEGSNKHIFHKDHLGSSTALTDISGNTAESANYMPFGSLRSHSGNVSDYKFTDHEFDTSTGLYNYGARLYDPIIGRFISADPTVQAPFDPQTLNRYSYCRNNPLIYVDPNGYGFFSSIGKAFKKVFKSAKKVVKKAVSFVGDVVEAVWQPAVQIAAGAIGFTIGGPWGAGILSGLTNFAITGDIKSAIGTGITAGLFYGAGQLFPENPIAHAVAGAVGGGASAALTGGDIASGMITGAVSGFSGTYLGQHINASGPISSLVARSAVGGVTGGLASVVSGGSFRNGFSQGAMIAGSATIFNSWSHILPGIGKAISGAYNSLRYNDQLHRGAADGFVRAGKIFTITHAFTLTKAFGLSQVAEAQPLQAAIGAQNAFQAIYDGLGPGAPSTLAGGAVWAVDKASKWIMNPPPWEP